MSELTTRLDVTRLAEYVNKISELSSINKMMAPTYLRDFIVGQDVAANMLARAMQADSKAKTKVEHMEAVAYLEKAKEYLDVHGIKDTSEARKQYVCLDKAVLEAKDEKAKTEAMVTLFKSKLSQLRQAHDTLKKIIYDRSNDTPWEGM
jgi:hypothetical protein